MIFARLRDPAQASTQQLVDVLEQLASVTQGASASDLESLAARPPLRQLLAELNGRLPRDAGERVTWEHSWTGRIARSLRDFRLSEVDTRLLVRLGNALVQAAPRQELDGLLHTACDICAVDRQGAAPDDYALWVLGTRLEELCSGKELGQLSSAQLVPLLHLFAHPSLRNRVAGRASPAVLRHVRHSLKDCQAGAIAKLLQAYSDVPSMVSDALQVLAERPAGGLAEVQLPELTAIAAALPGQDYPAVALAVLRRLREVLAEDPAASIELSTMTAANATGALPADVEGWEALRGAVDSLGGRAFGSAAAGDAAAPPREALLADTLALLLKLQLSGPAAVEPSSRQPPEWLSAAAAALTARVGEVSPPRLAELSSALADATVEFAAPELFAAVQLAAEAQATQLEAGDFGAIARSLASAGLLEAGLFEAWDVEARLTRYLPPECLASIISALAVAGVDGPVASALAETRLRACREKLPELPASDRARLYEALKVRSLLGNEWKSGTVGAELCSDSDWKANWLEYRSELSPPSLHGDLIEELLKEMSFKIERDVEGEDGLYNMAFFLPARNVVLDLLARPPRHPVSRQARGELILRHRVWSAADLSVLAVPDVTWAQLTKEALTKEEGRAMQKDWLRAKLHGIAREDLMKESGLQEETADQLAGVPFNDKGLNLEGLGRLAQQSATVRQRSVTRFLATWKDPSVRNPSAWLIGIIKKEEKAVAMDVERQKFESKQKELLEGRKAAAAARPEEGWSRSDGRSIEDAKPGEKVAGTVTNVMHRRVWVNAGFVSDVTFTAQPGRFQVGDRLINLEVASANHEKGWVEVKATMETRKLRASSAAAKASPGPRSAGAKASPAPKAKAKAKAKAGAKAKAKVTGDAADADATKPFVLDALAARPEEGWAREQGRALEKLKVGEVVGGRVTNVLHQRVWFDIGAKKDASFWAQAGQVFSVGDTVEGLRITSVHLQKGHVVVDPPESATPETKEAAKAVETSEATKAD